MLDLGVLAVKMFKRLEQTYHGLVCVLLELDKTHSGHILQVHVSVGALWGVSVQVWGGGGRGHPEGLVTVNLVSDYVVCLQQSLGDKDTNDFLLYETS